MHVRHSHTLVLRNIRGVATPQGVGGTLLGRLNIQALRMKAKDIIACSAPGSTMTIATFRCKDCNVLITTGVRADDVRQIFEAVKPCMDDEE